MVNSSEPSFRPEWAAPNGTASRLDDTETGLRLPAPHTLEPGRQGRLSPLRPARRAEAGETICLQKISVESLRTIAPNGWEKIMNLDEAQKKKVIAWIAEGLKVSEVQKRLDAELGVRMTYMEVRLLLDDLRLVPKDQPARMGEKELGQKVKASNSSPLHPANEPPASDRSLQASGQEQALGPKVSVSVDAVTQPGTLVSGTVTFSDGNTASWYLDQMGRLGLAPKQQGYRPSPEDIEDFQLEIQSELQKLGF